MKIKFISMIKTIFYIFTPEVSDSDCLKKQDDDQAEKLKTVVWIIIAILSGLIIGQLN